MMRKLLIPTDLTENSLELVEYALKLFSHEIMDLTLIYPYRLSDSDIDLYNYSPAKVIAEMSSEGFFSRKTEILKRYYVNINSIRVEVFTGITRSSFSNFTSSHHIKEAILPQHGFLDVSHPKTFDVLKMIEKEVPTIYRTDIGGEPREAGKEGKNEKGFFALIKKNIQGLLENETAA